MYAEETESLRTTPHRKFSPDLGKACQSVTEQECGPVSICLRVQSKEKIHEVQQWK